MRNIIIIIFAVSFFLNAQQWVNISPFPDSNYGVPGDFISEKEGWVHKGTSLGTDVIFHTDNGGDTWKEIYVPEDSLVIIISLEMIDSKYGWMKEIRGGNYYYLKTVDGGYNWEDMTNDLPIGSYRSLFFINRTTGFIQCGYNDSTYNPIIYKTINGGYNWHLVETPVVYQPHPYVVNYSVNKLFFLDDDHGWAGCSCLTDTGMLIYTVDGGETWQVGIEPGPGDIFDVHFIDHNTGGAVGYSWGPSVILTEDNFIADNSINYDWDILTSAIYFQNDSTIWIAGQPGKVYRSIDGGDTFSIYQTIDSDYIFKIQFFGDTGYFFGDDNALYRFDGDSTSIENGELRIENYTLQQNYPNPFNPSTEIEYSLKNSGLVKVSVFNSQGQFVKNLVSRKMEKGNHKINFNAEDLNSGVYYYQMMVDGVKHGARKMLYLR
ncbi:MAG: T9SS type A sorting domain-containing protein [Candidatus Delongbacteria bacterium]|nr:T9SS type A sorting domain-containing protein [Candidatus Delongbacteria bacterium]